MVSQADAESDNYPQSGLSIAELQEKLYDAAKKGDVSTLLQLASPFVLEIVPFQNSRSILHIAIKHGHTAFVREVLRLNPMLARTKDSHKSSPLHIAAAEGLVEICQILLSVAAETCMWHDNRRMNPLHVAAEKGYLEICQKLSSVAPESCWSRDCLDMNALHVAAMRGHVEIVEHLLQLNPLLAMERLGRQETVLHLCVRHNQLKSMKVLVDKLGGVLVDSINKDGETIMNLAVRSKQDETIQYLVESIKSKRRTPKYMLYTELDKTRLSDMMMVVAVLIATMAFQIALLSHWQEDTSSHEAGDAVMVYTTNRHMYQVFAVVTSGVAAGASVFTIFLIIITRLSRNNFLSSNTSSAIRALLISMTLSCVGWTMVIIPSEIAKSVAPIVDIVANLVSAVITVVVLSFCLLIASYLDWKRQIATVCPGKDLLPELVG